MLLSSYCGCFELGLGGMFGMKPNSNMELISTLTLARHSVNY